MVANVSRGNRWLFSVQINQFLIIYIYIIIFIVSPESCYTQVFTHTYIYTYTYISIYFKWWYIYNTIIEFLIIGFYRVLFFRVSFSFIWPIWILSNFYIKRMNIVTLLFYFLFILFYYIINTRIIINRFIHVNVSFSSYSCINKRKYF